MENVLNKKNIKYSIVIALVSASVSAVFIVNRLSQKEMDNMKTIQVGGLMAT